MAAPPPLYFAIPVWGDAYVDVFLRAALPTQLSPNNLPAVPNRERCRYNIYTTKADEPRIRASAAFQRLDGLIPVRIHHIDAPISERGDLKTWGNRYRAKSDCYRASIVEAVAADAANVMLNADILMADGFLKRSTELLGEGRRVIELLAPRGLKAPIQARLERDFIGRDGVSIDVSPRQLSSIWIDNMHPLVRMHAWEAEPGAPFHPSHIYWKVGRNSLLFRAYHLYPIIFWPRVYDRHFSVTVDADLVETTCPDMADAHIATDSDDLFCVELSDPEHFVGHLAHERTVRAILPIYRRSGGRRNFELLRHPLRIIGADETEAAWGPATRESGRIVAQVLRAQRLTEAMAPLRAVAEKTVRSLRARFRELKDMINPRPIDAGALNAALPKAVQADWPEPKIAVTTFTPAAPAIARILVMKLDPPGDLGTAVSALRRLRTLFPDARITLVCGTWNLAQARGLQIADEVVAFDFFSEDGQCVLLNVAPRVEQFRGLATGGFDLAIDLRVEGDTRVLLQEVSAPLKAGIGTQAQFGYLDIALPAPEAAEHRLSRMVFQPGHFATPFPQANPTMWRFDFGKAKGCPVYGPYLRLAPGSYRATFRFAIPRVLLGKLRAPIVFDVAANGDPVASLECDADRLATLRSGVVSLDFENPTSTIGYEFRIYWQKVPCWGHFRFFGLTLDRTGYLPSASLRREEYLSLLVELIGLRTAAPRPIGSVHVGAPRATPRRFLVAPLSGAAVRDWPMAHYTDVVRRLLEQVGDGGEIVLLGSADQTLDIDQGIRLNFADNRVVTVATDMPRERLREIMGSADLLIGNHAELAAVAAEVGLPSLTIYAGSQDPAEWAPRGPTARAMHAAVGCAPCRLITLSDCGYAHRCMRSITPDAVLEQVTAMLDAAGAARAAPAEARQAAPL